MRIMGKHNTGRPRCEHGCTEDQHPNCFRINEHDQTKDSIRKEYSSNAGTITTTSAKIDSLERAVEYAKIDLSIWNIKRHIINSWEVTISKRGTDTGKPETYTNFQVKIWLERKKPQETALENLCKRLEQQRINGRKPAKVKRLTLKGDYMLEVSLFDMHFGKLAWAEESGENYDLKIAEGVFLNAISELIAKTKHYPIEKIIFPTGNDFFHVNGPDNVTPTNKNPLQVDNRLPKIFETGFLAMIQAIEACAEIAPVEIIYVPSNHDPQTSFFLCHTLRSYFHNNPNVIVDVSPKHRKYIQYGVNALMFTHSPNIKSKSGLPLIMAAEEPEIWATSKHREIHTGHFHIAREIDYFAADTHGPVRIRVIPSLTGTDSWHYEMGFVKTARAAEAYFRRLRIEQISSLGPPDPL